MTKRFFSIAAVALLVLVLTACGKHQPNTPEGVATAAMNCIIDKDYEGYVDLMYFKDGKELSKERRQQLIVLVEDKVGDKAAEKGGIKDFKVGIPELDGDKGTVPVEVTYGDDSTKDQSIAVVKSPDGDWRLDPGK
jgi:hypothetical protein